MTPQRIAEVVEACQRQGLAFTPTLSSSRNLMRLQNWADERNAHDVRLLPRMYSDVVWHPQHGLPAYRGMGADDFERAHDAWGRKLSLVAALADAGVPLRLGTDTQQPFAVPGAALHAEIAAFAEAGISRSSSWRTASRDAAPALGVSDAGRLAAGQRADLLVTPRNPFDPGWSPREISATICAGACLMAKDLDAAVDQALSRFEGRIGDHVSRWLARFALDRTARNFVGLGGRMAVGFEDNWVHDRLGLAELVARMDVDPTEPVEAVIARAEIVQSAINVIALHSFDQASSSWSALLR